MDPASNGLIIDLFGVFTGETSIAELSGSPQRTRKIFQVTEDDAPCPAPAKAI
jgi:hypothetical protein